MEEGKYKKNPTHNTTVIFRKTADPLLTDLGKDQARLAHEAWVTELSNGLPLPHKFYCSPMTRALHTHSITFDGILPAPRSDSKLTPVILEVCRVTHSCHVLSRPCTSTNTNTRSNRNCVCGNHTTYRTCGRFTAITHAINEALALR